MPTSKEDLLKFVVELPDDSTIDDIEYYLYVRRKIENGREAARRGEVITQDEFKKRMNEWSEKSLGRSLQ
jgi:hypothetical protein